MHRARMGSVWALAAALGLPGLAAAQAGDTPATDAEVKRAVFSLAIEEREPEDVISQLETGSEQIYFFTELLGLEGKTVVHRWELNGEVVAEVPFEVRGPRWRVYSSKRLLPEWGGRWQVTVVDENGQTLRSETLAYVDAGSDPGADAPLPAAPSP